MKILTVANRIQLSFAAAVTMVLIIGFLSFYYLNQLNRGLERIVDRDIRLARITEEIKNSLFDAYRQERVLPPGQIPPAQLEQVRAPILALAKLTDQAKELSSKDVNIARYSEMSTLVTESLGILNQIPLSPDDSVPRGELRKKMAGIIALSREALQERYQDLDTHQEELDRLSSSAQRNMIIVMIVLLISAATLGFVAPRIVTNPFKKMSRAISEVRTGNLDVKIPVEADDELSEIAVSLNKMLSDINTFDQMKIKRIAFEKRRFETLANMVDYGVMVLKREGEIEFINSQLYVLFNLPSHEVECKKFDKTPLPQEIKELLEECLVAKEKIDGREINVHLGNRDGEDIELTLVADTSMVRTHDGTVVNILLTFEEKVTASAKQFLTRQAGKKEEVAES